MSREAAHSPAPARTPSAPARAARPAAFAGGSAATVQANGQANGQARGACACGGGCPRCRHAAVSQPGSAPELQADRIARAISPNPSPARQRAPEPVREGQPLPAALRRHYEPRFGTSLAQLRLHTGPRAEAAAAAVQAHAYTHRGQIVLGRDRPAVPSYTVAHEIAHALLHDHETVWREPYTTAGQVLDRSSINALAGSDYWTFRTGQRYGLTFDARMTGDAEERDAVLSVFLAGNPPATVATQRVIEVKVAERTVGTATRPALHYRVTLDPPAAAGELPAMSAVFVAELTAPATGAVAPPANYANRGNATDYNLEQLRGRRRDALGTLTLPAGMPADEVAPVQHAVAEYFDNANARNTEVDAVIPVGSGSRTVLYTLVFGASNNVTATRIGEAGSGTGMVNRDRIDITRVRGFPGATAAPAALQAWWGQRYPGGGTLTLGATPTAADVMTEMNRLVTAGIGGRGWFATVYGINVTDAIGLEGRLTGTHSVPSTMLLDCQDPSAADLRRLELALQTMTASELQRLRGIVIGRKGSAFSGTAGAGGAITWGAGTRGQFGITLHHGSDVTVVYFGALSAIDPHLFRGSSAANALSDSVGGVLHELGHAGAHIAGIEAAFNAWFRARRQVAPTWYAATDSAEVFPEAYMLYHADPHFLCTRAPQVYAWIDQWATTGTAPTGTAALTAPASCPP